MISGPIAWAIGLIIYSVRPQVSGMKSLVSWATVALT